HEIEDQECWLYFEAVAPAVAADGHDAASFIEVHHTVMLDVNERQINTITFTIRDQRSTLSFTRETPPWQRLPLALRALAPPETAGEWLRTNAIDLDAAADAEALPILDLLGDRRLVLLGATRGDGAASQTKASLARGLLGSGRFTTLALELDPLSTLREETAAVARLHATPGRIAGFGLPTLDPPTGTRLLGLIASVAPDAITPDDHARLEQLAPPTAAADRVALETLAAKLRVTLRDRREAFAETHGDAVTAALTRVVEDLPVAIRVAPTGPADADAAAARRDLAIARNLMRLLRSWPPAERVVVWFDRARVDRATATAGATMTAGSWLRQRLRGDAVTTYSILFLATDRDTPLDRLFRPLGPGRFLVDLRRVEPGHWLTQPQSGQPMGVPTPTTAVWPVRADAIVVTRPDLTPRPRGG
ncbi:MAG: hypothetical protein HKN62_17580, partial [Phycisphaerales bacterium]|nr:hypothetical protein [Phycisphaerales bacterium]